MQAPGRQTPRALGGWLVLGVRQLALTVVTVGGVVTLGRILGPAGFAVYGYVTIGITLALAVGDFGLSGRIIRDRVSAEDLRVVFGVQLGLVAALGAAAAAALPAVPPRDRLQVALIVVAMLLALLQTLPTAALERRLDFRRVGQIEVGQRALFTALAISLCAAGMTRTGIALAAVLAGAASYAAALAAAGWRARPRLGSPRRLLGGFAAHWWHGRLAAQLAYTAFPVLGGLLFGAREVGHLTLALTIASLTTLLAPLVARATFPAMSAAAEHRRPEVFADVFRAFVVASVPLLAIVVVGAREIVRAGFGEEWLGAVDVVRMTCASALVGLALTPSLPLLYLLLDPRAVKRALVAWFAAQWTLGLALAAALGPIGIPAASTLAAGLALGILDRRLRAAAGGFSLVGELAPAVLAALPGVAAGMGLAAALGGGAPGTAAGAVVCLLVYGVAVGSRRRLLNPRRLGRALAEGARPAPAA